MECSGWELTEKGWYRCLRFNSFSALTAFLAELGPVADAQEHHPDMRIRKAVLLDVYLFTHDAGCVTAKDERLAAEIDRLYGRGGPD